MSIEQLGFYLEQHQEKGKAFQDLPQAECLERFNTQWVFLPSCKRNHTQPEEGTLKENPNFVASKDTQVT